MRNIYLIVGSWLLLGALVVIGGLAIAAPYVPPKTFAPGDPILSSDFNTMNSALAASINNVTSAQITDSTITSADLGPACVTSNALATNAVTAGKIDSGAIYSDTQLAPSFTVAAARFISSTETQGFNFTRSISGYYYGDGSDTRLIYNTVMIGPNKQSAQGVNIPFNITRVDVYAATGISASHVIIMDALSDSGVLEYSYDAAGSEKGYYFRRHTTAPMYTWSAGNYPAIYNGTDSHGFRTTYNSDYATNKSGDLYIWVAYGY